MTLISVLTFGGTYSTQPKTMNEDIKKKDIMLCVWNIPDNSEIAVKFSPTGEDGSWDFCKFSDGSDMIITSNRQVEFRSQIGFLKLECNGDTKDIKATLL